MHSRGWMIATLALMALLGSTVVYGAFVFIDGSIEVPAGSDTTVRAAGARTTTSATEPVASDPAPKTPIMVSSTGGDDHTVVVVVYTDVHLRAAASTNAPVLHVLPLGQELVVAGPVEHGSDYSWYPVIHPIDATQVGYVATMYVSTAE